MSDDHDAVMRRIENDQIRRRLEAAKRAGEQKKRERQERQAIFEKEKEKFERELYDILDPVLEYITIEVTKSPVGIGKDNHILFVIRGKDLPLFCRIEIQDKDFSLSPSGGRTFSTIYSSEAASEALRFLASAIEDCLARGD